MKGGTNFALPSSILRSEYKFSLFINSELRSGGRIDKNDD